MQESNTPREERQQESRRERRRSMVAAHAAVAVTPNDLMLLDLAALVFGTTRKAIEGKIARGQWVEGRQFHKDPDGKIWIDRQGVHRWVTTGKP